jgi:hypothetical protein
MILSAHQPAYLPWLGYLEKIACADVFVYLDTVQFEKNSFINRNRIKTPQGAQWLTIPVKAGGHLSGTLRDVAIDNVQPWRKKHLKTIAMNYSRAARYAACSGKLAALLTGTQANLVELCWWQLRFWLDEFGITTKVLRASELAVSGTKSGLILQLCRSLGADHYLSGALGPNYLVVDDFRAARIKLTFQNYTSPAYPQLWGDFIPNLSVIDYWLNCGTGSLPTRTLVNEIRGSHSGKI